MKYLLFLIILFETGFAQADPVFQFKPYITVLKPNEKINKKISVKELKNKGTLVVEYNGNNSQADTARFKTLKVNLNGKELLNAKNADSNISYEFSLNVSVTNEISIEIESTGSALLIVSILNSEKYTITKTIGKDGGTIELPNILSITFPKETFDSNVSVELEATNTDETKKDYYRSLFMGMGPRLPYEIRIITEKAKIKKPIHISFYIPKSFLNMVKNPIPTAQTLSGGKDELHDDFEGLLGLKANSDKSIIEVTGEERLFTDIRRKDAKQEAIFVITSDSAK